MPVQRGDCMRDDMWEVGSSMVAHDWKGSTLEMNVNQSPDSTMKPSKGIKS